MKTYAPNVIHEVDPSNCLPHPTNRKPNPKHVKELAVSIKTSGQVTPAMARPHPEQPGKLELAAGYCRTKACESLGTKVRVVVAELSDKEIREIVLLENLQREDLDPYDEAAKLKDAIDNDINIKEMAASLGKTSAWLKTRLRLTRIREDIVTKVRGTWALDAAEALGDLPHDTQGTIFEYFEYDRPESAKEVLAAVHRHSVPIAGLEFLKDPATANEKTGCSDGCKSSNEGMLFKLEGNCTQCTNRDCIRTRFAKHALNEVKRLIAEYPGRVVMANRFAEMFRREEFPETGANGRLDGVMVFNDWQPRKILGRATSKITDKTWFLLARSEENEFQTEVWTFIPAQAKKAEDGKPAKTTTDELQPGRPDRVDLLKGKRFMALHAQVVEKLTEFKFPPKLERLLAAFGTATNYSRGDYRGDRWEMHSKGVFHNGNMMPKISMTEHQFLVEQLRNQMLSRLETKENPTQSARNSALVTEVENVAAWMGLDLDAMKKAIAEEILPPKSWADQVDPITLEPK